MTQSAPEPDPTATPGAATAGAPFAAPDLTAALAALGTSRLFERVDLPTLLPHMAGARLLTVQPGEVLLDPEVVNHEIYLILRGELLVCLEPRVVNPLVRLRVGDCVGELSVIDERPPSAYVVAAESTELLAVPKALLWHMMAQHNALALNLLKVLTARIRESNTVLLGSMRLQRQYRSKAETDALTGLNNRVWFEEVFPRQLDLCERTGQHACLVMLDIDHFKRVNDQFGHAVGDQALVHVANLLRANLRSTDLCARFGGEEIIILMPGCDMGQAEQTAERLRASIAGAAMPLSTGGALFIQVSGGIAQWNPGTHLTDLMRSADQALYRAKQNGRNQMALSPVLPEIIRRH